MLPLIHQSQTNHKTMSEVKEILEDKKPESLSYRLTGEPLANLKSQQEKYKKKYGIKPSLTELLRLAALKYKA